MPSTAAQTSSFLIFFSRGEKKMFVIYKDVRGGSLIRLLAPLYATTTTTWAKPGRASVPCFYFLWPSNSFWPFSSDRVDMELNNCSSLYFPTLQQQQQQQLVIFFSVMFFLLFFLLLNAEKNGRTFSKECWPCRFLFHVLKNKIKKTRRVWK